MRDYRLVNTWLTIGFIALAACSSVPFSVQTPVVDVDSLTLLESTQAGQRYLVALRLRNPNDVSITLRGLEFNIRLGGEGFIDGSADQLIILAPNGEASIRVDVVSEFVSSVSRLMSYLRGPESTIPYVIDGELALDTRPPRFIRFDGGGRTPLMIVAGR